MWSRFNGQGCSPRTPVRPSAGFDTRVPNGDAGDDPTIRVADVAAHVRVSLATLYRHLPSVAVAWGTMTDSVGR